MKDFPLSKKKPKKFVKAKPKNNTTLPKLPQSAHSSTKAFLATQPLFSFRHKFPKKSTWYPKYKEDIQLAMVPLVLFGIFFVMDIINNHLFHQNTKQEFTYHRFVTKINPYPYLKEAQAPDITAKAAIILDRDAQVILYSKNPQLRFSMASTTKIMTALTAMDYFRLDDVLTIKQSKVEGSGLGFVQGERYTFESLLYAMMLPSANDAAVAIADNYPWGGGAFVDRMNRKAASLHLTNTHFADPSGLDDDGDYTTVVDLARLASYAMQNPTLMQITGTKNKSITNTSLSRQFTLSNLNKLLGTSGVTGMKTGTTEGAGEVLVSSVTKDNHTYVIIVMQSTNRFADTSALLTYLENNIQYITPQEMKN